MRSAQLSLAILLCTALVAPISAEAANPVYKICRKNTDGSLAVRVKCRKTETALTNISSLEGTDGADGASFHQTIPSGVTLTGLIGTDVEAPATSGDFRVLHSFPAPVGRLLADTDIIVANTTAVDNDCSGSVTCLSNTEAAAASECTGTAAAPTAPAGKVCIYPISATNARSIDGFALNPTGATLSYGFVLDFGVDGAVGDTLVRATWAYTQP